MIRKEATLQSPLRILDRSIRGGLGKGHLGLIMAPPGVGKSACLVQIGLDALLRDKPVLHVALGQSVEHVAARYGAHFDDLADRVALKDRGGVRRSIGHRRLIWSLPGHAFGPPSLDEALEAFHAHLGVWPWAVLVDGFAWVEPGCAAAVRALKAGAARVDAQLWMTARDALGAGAAGRGLAPLSDGVAALVDVAIHLEPEGRHARLTLVKDFDRYPGSDVSLVLEGGALRLASEDEAPPPPPAPLLAEDCTLYASGSPGAEEEFGACAERWGVREVNFTFAGRHGAARTRGLVELGEEELRLGEVSPAYVKAHLHRALSDSPELGRVLQAIWHQVSKAAEVFAVGALHADKTAHGGTGWAVELARHWGKPAHVFDQARRAWFRWDGSDWGREAPPVITCEDFAGAGTRTLSAEGRAAIGALFERSFGAPPTAPRT